MIVRPATPADAGVIADIDHAAKAAALPTVQWAHTPDEVRQWIATVLIPGGGVFVAESGAEPVGYIALHDNWVNQLYVRPDHWRQGVGTGLLDFAKAQLTAGFGLWCFQVNARARRFYEKHGLVAERLTDGDDNEEREPDVLYVWHPPT